MTATPKAGGQLPVYSTVEDFVTLLGQCPISGDTKTDQINRTYWRLGLAEGITAALTLEINDLRPANARPLKRDIVLQKVILPIVQGSDLEWAMKQVERLIANKRPA